MKPTIEEVETAIRAAICKPDRDYRVTVTEAADGYRASVDGRPTVNPDGLVIHGRRFVVAERVRLLRTFRRASYVLKASRRSKLFRTIPKRADAKAARLARVEQVNADFERAEVRQRSEARAGSGP